ncbi:MAG: gliding motility-associated C-terminal domain-containing protein [Bacteroidales bacterium]|nr:gliding motility-associated C-terminal domain-containing protein [Bacteroidales bacterium]
MQKRIHILISIIVFWGLCGHVTAKNTLFGRSMLSDISDTIIIHSLNDTVIKLTSQGFSDSYDWTALDPDDTANILTNGTATVSVISHPSDTAVYLVNIYNESTENMIPNGDFEQGNTGFTSEYSYTSSTGNRALWDQGKYTVGYDVSDYHERWASCSNGSKMFIANGGADNNSVVYSTNLNVDKNTDYIVSFEACNIASTTRDASLSKFQFSINGVQLGSIHQVKPQKCEWSEFYQIWNSGNSLTAKIIILNKNTENDGNDFALDNISFRKIEVTYDTFVVINNFDFDTINDTICLGQEYEFAGQKFVSDTSVTDTLYDIHTVRTLNLTVNATLDSVIYDTICSGQTYTLNGFNADREGVYTLTVKTQTGCDSIVTLYLAFNPVYNDTLIALGCDEGFYDYGFNVEQSGFYTQSLVSRDGCDSIVNLIFTRTELFVDTIKAEIYKGDTFTYYGFSESESGEYSQVFQDTNGCDSTYILNLKVISLHFPNVVTPNGDGINDIFESQDLLEQTMFEETTLRVYNRYGRTIYKVTNPRTREDLWNPDATNTPTGTYFYRFTAKSKKKNIDYVGTVDVLR